MDPEFRKEVIELAKVIDDMDYYQILQIRQKAFTQEIKKAYFKQSRKFHPDKYYNEDPRLLAVITKIFKRIAEAYKILSDQDRRALYTKSISGPNRKKMLRFNPKLIEAEQKEKEDEGQTAMGKKYYQMAKDGIRNKDYKSAKINLQLAMKMEPKNETFKKRMDEINEIMEMARRAKKKPK
jgi:curved DNA-binding protein CbpA